MHIIFVNIDSFGKCKSMIINKSKNKLLEWQYSIKKLIEYPQGVCVILILHPSCVNPNEAPGFSNKFLMLRF